MTEFSNSQIYMEGMGWATMKYKIGRLPEVALDGLSYANYHKAMRERVLMNSGFYNPSSSNENFLYDENGDVKRFVEDYFGYGATTSHFDRHSELTVRIKGAARPYGEDGLKDAFMRLVKQAAVQAGCQQCMHCFLTNTCQRSVSKRLTTVHCRSLVSRICSSAPSL